MTKVTKIIAIIFMAMTMLIGVFAISGCDNISLDEYKTTAKATIQTYALEKGLNNEYNEENWATIESLVAQGEAAVAAASNKPAVDAAVTTAKLAMDAVEPILSEELIDRIKADYLQEFGHELFFGNELLNKYYGIYNGAAVFFIAGDNAALKTVVISGVEFSYSYGWMILVWKDGVFYNLENIEPIFEANILTQRNLEQIGIIHAEARVSGVSIKEDLELTEELENKIKADYLQEFGRAFHFDRFYGLFNGSAVFFIEADDFSLKEVIIAEQTFTANSHWTILVWKDGSFYDLESIESIFNAGVLTQADLIKIAAIHAEANAD